MTVTGKIQKFLMRDAVEARLGLKAAKNGLERHGDASGHRCLEPLYPVDRHPRECGISSTPRFLGVLL